MKRKKSGSVLNWILNILLAILPLVLVLVLNAFIGNLKPQYKNTFYGYRPYVVVTGSMEPTIMPKTLVIGKAVDFAELDVGDIITFEAEIGGRTTLNTHTVVEKKQAFITTKGDNCAVADDEKVTQSNYRYKVVKILGWTSKLNTVSGILLYLFLPSALLAAALAGAAVCLLLLRKKRRANRANAEEQEQGGEIQMEQMMQQPIPPQPIPPQPVQLQLLQPEQPVQDEPAEPVTVVAEAIPKEPPQPAPEMQPASAQEPDPPPPDPDDVLLGILAECEARAQQAPAGEDDGWDDEEWDEVGISALAALLPGANTTANGGWDNIEWDEEGMLALTSFWPGRDEDDQLLEMLESSLVRVGGPDTQEEDEALDWETLFLAGKPF